MTESSVKQRGFFLMVQTDSGTKKIVKLFWPKVQCDNMLPCMTIFKNEDNDTPGGGVERVSHIVPHKHTPCPTFGLLGPGHPSWKPEWSI